MKDWSEYLEYRNGVLGGKIHIKNTRIGVDLILEKISMGESIEQIMESFPHITREQILACVQYALKSVRNENIYEFV